MAPPSPAPESSPAAPRAAAGISPLARSHSMVIARPSRSGVGQ